MLIQECVLMQSVSDGKSVIIEGFHLDPALYLKEFDIQSALSDNTTTNRTYYFELGAMIEGNTEQRPSMNEECDNSSNNNALVLGDHAVLFLARTEDGTKKPIPASNMSENAAIFIPLILDIPEEHFETDAQAWLEEILHSSCNQFDTISSSRRRRVIDTMQSIKKYIKSSSLDCSVPCITLDIFDLDSSLDQIHEYIIACIELSLLDSIIS